MDICGITSDLSYMYMRFLLKTYSQNIWSYLALFIYVLCIFCWKFPNFLVALSIAYMAYLRNMNRKHIELAEVVTEWLWVYRKLALTRCPSWLLFTQGSLKSIFSFSCTGCFMQDAISANGSFSFYHPKNQKEKLHLWWSANATQVSSHLRVFFVLFIWKPNRGL